MELLIKYKVIVPETLNEREVLELLLAHESLLNNQMVLRYHLNNNITAKTKIKPKK